METNENGMRNTQVRPWGSAKRIVKDRGWGWVIAFAAFFNTMFTVGSVPALGAYFTDWQTEFSSTRSSISGVSSLCFSTICLATPVGTLIARRFSCRTAIFSGGILMALGHLLAFFSNSLLHLYIFIGIIAYFGGSFAYTVSYVSIAEHNDKRLSLANAIANCGCPIATMVLPVLMDWIRSELTWRNAVLVSAGIYFHICIAGVLMKPNEPRRVEEEEEEEEIVRIRPPSEDLDEIKRVANAEVDAEKAADAAAEALLKSRLTQDADCRIISSVDGEMTQPSTTVRNMNFMNVCRSWLAAQDDDRNSAPLHRTI